MEQMYLRAAHVQADVLRSAMGSRHPKTEDTPPKKVLKTLKRMASASIPCFETHRQLSTYQSIITKKLGLKAYTGEDIHDIRRICETLVYFIQWASYPLF